jgi:hypothetical protein
MNRPRYLSNNAEIIPQVLDSQAELIKSLTSVVTGCPPRKPWFAEFRPDALGFFTGPTSIAYVFLWLSKIYPALTIEGKLPKQWCDEYLGCGSDELTEPVPGGGIGIKSEYFAFNAVKAATTQDMKYVERLKNAAIVANSEAPAEDTEWWVGRAGTLAHLRIARHFVPAAAEVLNEVMEPLIQHILTHKPWEYHGEDYIAPAHGILGIITQIILCNTAHAPALEGDLTKILDSQQEDGAVPILLSKRMNYVLVQFCHGSPGFVLSLLKLRPHFPGLHDRIDRAIQLGRKNIWEHGLLTKQPNLCHGITGNALGLEKPEREHFMSYATMKKIGEGLEDKTFSKGDDKWGLLWGEAGRAWGWMAMDENVDLGFPAYTEG